MKSVSPYRLVRSLSFPRDTRRRLRGQSLAEFVLVLPILLLIVLIGLDFGRVYLGYVNIQNMARIAANYAANNPTAPWGNASDTRVLAYRNQILNDARATNCRLPQASGSDVVPGPVFADRTGNGSGSDVGDAATVSITCTFTVVTPVISGIVGNNGDIDVTASAEFPVKTGLIGRGGTISVAPNAAFVASPLNGPAPLAVTFTDQSTGSPTDWAWDFNNDGTIDSEDQDPTFTFSAPGIYTVTLVVTNGAGSDTETRNNYITVGTPLSAVSFTAEPNTGPRPLFVQFTDTSTNDPTAWEWDFDDDGTIDSTLQNPTHYYWNVGTYSVRLTVTNAGGTTSTLVSDLITVTVGTCRVPNFAGVSSSSAQALWESRNFTSTVRFQQGGLPWTINSQSQVVDQEIPCDSPITVSKN